MKIKKEFKDGGLYFFANLINKGMSFLTVPIFTRIMTTNEYGQVDTYLSLVSLMLPIVGLYLGKAKRNAYTDFPNDLNSFDKTIHLCSTISTIIVIFLVILIGNLIKFSLPNILIAMCCIQAFMSYIIECKLLSLLMERKALKRAVLMILPNIIISILSLLIMIKIKDGKQYVRIIVYFIVYLIVGGYIYIKNIFTKNAKFKNKYISYAATISIPLIFHGIAASILSSSDRIMITYFYSSSETGIYSLYYNVSLITLVFVSAIENVWIPWFTNKMLKKEESKISMVANMSTFVVALFTVIIMMISPEIIKIMSDEKYWGNEILIIPVIIVPFITYVYTNLINYEQFQKKTKKIARNTFIAAILNIILNVIFIPHYGALAAACTTLMSYLILYYIYYYTIEKQARKLFNIKYFYLSLLLIIFFIFLFIILIDKIIIRYLIAIMIICILIYILIKNIKLLKG